MNSDEILEWRACGECGRVHHDPTLRLLDVSEACPACGRSGIRSIWPGFSLDAIDMANGAGLDLTDERMLRASCVLAAACAEAMLGEVLFRVADRSLHGLTNPSRFQYLAAMKTAEVDGRKPRLDEYRRLVGKSAKDAIGPSFGRWWASWEFIVDHRNAFGHGVRYRRHAKATDAAELPLHIEIVRKGMLAAFAAMTNAAMDALYPISR